jgi:PTS system mannose-specific IIB component
MSLFSSPLFGSSHAKPATEPGHPIALARVDNRLVHGQILSAWVPALNADTLLVIDDEAARNTLIRSAMEIAIPPDLQFEVSPVDGANAKVARLRPGAHTIVLFRDVAEVVRAVEGGLVLSKLNLGNIHYAAGRSAISQAVHLSTAELLQLEKLEERGVAVELKTLPRDAGVPLAEIKRRLQAGSAA